MKKLQKTLTKRLTLSREALGRLDDGSQDKVRGGASLAGGSNCSDCPTCASCTGRCCPP